jgi:hypothetical protein
MHGPASAVPGKAGARNWSVARELTGAVPRVSRQCWSASTAKTPVAPVETTLTDDNRLPRLGCHCWLAQQCTVGQANRGTSQSEVDRPLVGGMRDSLGWRRGGARWGGAMCVATSGRAQELLPNRPEMDRQAMCALSATSASVAVSSPMGSVECKTRAPPTSLDLTRNPPCLLQKTVSLGILSVALPFCRARRSPDDR